MYDRKGLKKLEVKPISFSLLTIATKLSPCSPGMDQTENISSFILCSLVAGGETPCPQSCSLAAAVVLSPVYTAVTRLGVCMLRYIRSVVLQDPTSRGVTLLQSMIVTNCNTFHLHLQFELKELKRRQEEEERKRQEELAAKQTPPPSSPDDQPSERSVELLFMSFCFSLHSLLIWWEWMCACAGMHVPTLQT